MGSPGVKFLQVLSTDDEILNRVQANVAEALRRIVDNTTAAVAATVNSLAPVGSAPNSNGATLVNGVLTLEPASTTKPGVVTAGTQSFGGDKTLSTGQWFISWDTASAVYFPRLTLQNLNPGGVTSNAWVNDVGFATNNLYGSTWFVGAEANYYIWVTNSGVKGFKFNAQKTTGDYAFQVNTVDVFKINSSGVQIVGTLKMPNADSTATPGSVTNNNPTGRAAINTGGTTCVVTNSSVAAADSVLISRLGRDVTATDLWVSAVAAGSFTVTSNAIATAPASFMFVVVKA